MKKCITLSFFVFLSFLAHAQWSNTTNQFYDSLHMPVSLATFDQKQSIVVKSYPDSGYFVIWLDYRDQSTNNSDIYAQKFDKTGKALWATNGVPVVAGPGYQTFAPPSNADYRYYNYACTDSAGGFYIAWDDDNSAVRSTIAHRVSVQHMTTNGSAVFAFPGAVIAAAAPDLSYQYTSPQLIADGNKGFFIGYLKIGSYANDMYVQCYRDEGGTLVSYGGGQMDVNGINVPTVKVCGLGNDINALDARVTGFNIYPDLQGGCGVVMTMDWNTGGNERVFTGYNKLCRVKKESHVTVFKRTSDIATSTAESYTYKKDSVVRLYNYRTYSNAVSCKDIGGNLYEYTDYYVENGGNGYANVSVPVYGTEYAKGTMIATSGNINVNLIATCQRNLNPGNATVGYWYKRLYYFADEQYDSIPYQLASDSDDPYFAYRPLPEGKVLNKLSYGGDTVLGQSVYDYDFALAATGNRIFATGMLYNSPAYNYRYCNLQQLQLDRESPDSFAIHTQTGGDTGLTIGREINTGFSGTSINYDNPLITADLRGNALFTITEVGRYVRVSPIGDSAKLLWGPMGSPIGTGLFDGRYDGPGNPHVAMSPDDGTAVVAWDNSRYIPPTETYEDVYMRHLDSLKIYDYAPPVRALMTLNYAGSALSTGVLFGTTGKWAEFDGFNGTTFQSTPVLSLTDTYNLGNISGGVYDYLQSPLRTAAGKPYLSRNWLISPEHNPAGAATIGVRLFFTTDQFTQLQTADPTIKSPSDLVVIKQPSTGTNAPTEYTPATNDDFIAPTDWQPVTGGYYVEIPVTSFSNFFIEKNNGVLPVTWLGVSASRGANSMATVNWSVANETNIKNYTVQYSIDGIVYKDGCTVNASGSGRYSCAIPADAAKVYYFRVRETDLDGRSGSSSVVRLDKLSGAIHFALSPNPARSAATLSYTVPTPGSATLTLSNGAGAILWQQRQTWGTSGTATIPVRSLPAGIYYLRITTGSTNQTLRLEKGID